MLRRVALLVCLIFVTLPAAALARAPSFPIISGFHSVLAFGEGEGTSVPGLAAFEANGTVPAADLATSLNQMNERTMMAALSAVGSVRSAIHWTTRPSSVATGATSRAIRAARNTGA